MNELTLTVLGCRGSIPCAQPEHEYYGGNTTSFLIQGGDEAIVIDGGTGIISLRKYMQELPKRMTILITHPHLDHMIGLPMLGPGILGAMTVDVIGADRKGMSVLDQLSMIMRPPLWPVGAECLGSNLRFRNLPERQFSSGCFRILHDEGNHPGGCTMFRIEYEDKSLVFSGDFEHAAGAAANAATVANAVNGTETAADAAAVAETVAASNAETETAAASATDTAAADTTPPKRAVVERRMNMDRRSWDRPEGCERRADQRLINLARDCDMLIYDGHFTEAQYELHMGWGHSYPEKGVELANKAGAKSLLITHHGLSRTDDIARIQEKELQGLWPAARFAVQGKTYRF